MSHPGLLADIAMDTLHELVDELEETAANGPRWPVIRSGQREPICPLVRWLVWHRDGGRCKFCSRSDIQVELDHVIPWLAPDRVRHRAHTDDHPAERTAP